MYKCFLCRQLPLIAALLKGKTQFSFGEMRHKNYLLLFTHILGLMETLQPHIFRKEQTALVGIIESYFSLILVSNLLLFIYILYILGLMETLQPHIFHKEQTALVGIIESYFSLMSMDYCVAWEAKWPTGITLSGVRLSVW